MEKALITKEQLVDLIDPLFSVSEPWKEIHSLLKGLLKKGFHRESIISALQAYFLQLRIEKKEREEDIIGDCLDFFEGWCNPELKL